MIGTVIHSLLSADTTITDAVGDNIYPIIVPQNSPFPAITYQLIGSEPMEIKGFQKIADTASVQINVFADTYSKTVAIAKAVKDVLDYAHGFELNDINICSVTPEMELDGIYDDTLNLYSRILKYEISINQPYTL